jgi:hypothetical protein
MRAPPRRRAGLAAWRCIPTRPKWSMASEARIEAVTERHTNMPVPTFSAVSTPART